MKTREKFDYQFMFNDEDCWVVFNKKLYTKEQALKLGTKEIKEIIDHFGYYERTDFEVWSSQVKYGFYRSFDGTRFNGWHLPNIVGCGIYDITNGVDVWVVGVKPND